MPKSLALFDIDNTMYDGFSYFELLAAQVDEGLLRRQTLEEANNSMRKYTSKLQDYETTVIELLDIYAAGLAGVSYEAALRSAKNFYTHSDRFFPYVEPTMRKLRVSHDIILVTGEPQFVAEAVSSLFIAASHYSSEYGVVNGKFTGKVTKYLASRHEKHNAIKHLMQGHAAKESFAFGDSEGDIEMLRAVEYPICLNCTEGLRAIARNEGWYTPDIRDVPDLVASLGPKAV